MSIEAREHNDNYLVTKVWPESKAVNTMIIDKKEAEILVKQLRNKQKTPENTDTHTQNTEI